MRTERHIFQEQKVRVQKNEVFIGGGVHWSLGSDQSEIRRRLLNSSNAQSFRHLDNLEQFIKVVIDDFGYFAVEYHE